MISLFFWHASDGWPVNGLKARHSAWSCSSTLLNRDPVERGKAHNLLHHFTTAGGKSPKSFTGIGKLLVDDLLRAWRVGVRIFDGVTQEWFLCRVKLLFLLADYPGIIARWHGLSMQHKYHSMLLAISIACYVAR